MQKLSGVVAHQWYNFEELFLKFFLYFPNILQKACVIFIIKRKPLFRKTKKQKAVPRVDTNVFCIAGKDFFFFLAACEISDLISWQTMKPLQKEFYFSLEIEVFLLHG